MSGVGGQGGIKTIILNNKNYNKIKNNSSTYLTGLL